VLDIRLLGSSSTRPLHLAARDHGYTPQQAVDESVTLPPKSVPAEQTVLAAGLPDVGAAQLVVAEAFGEH
jgi:hypothetical protein